MDLGSTSAGASFSKTIYLFTITLPKTIRIVQTYHEHSSAYSDSDVGMCQCENWCQLWLAASRPGPCRVPELGRPLLSE